MISITPIGIVRNGIDERPQKWADIQSEIHVKSEYQDALDGLEEFSHIVVLFYFHLSSSHLLKVHPRKRDDLPLVGVFSTRAPVRPNFIGMSVVELVGIDQNVVTVKELDAFDGTPVIDLKPHFSAVSPTSVPEWVNL